MNNDYLLSNIVSRQLKPLGLHLPYQSTNARDFFLIAKLWMLWKLFVCLNVSVIDRRKGLFSLKNDK